MTAISPLLQNKLNATNNGKQTPNNRHEKVYQDLQKRAHEAKPNEAKAKLVNEGILGNPITATKDIIKDGKNFFKATATGNMGDNSLGRINDLGLKIGAGLIATFLALHSKTKTESIMKFVGGATFIAMMDLWPKLFINLPARLVHGFRIDRKYISAQGDKKDFFLDNQFLVWDAYPEEQLRKDAKKAGIDYDSENGKEKIQRKMQKTALQNRTLAMATAGFATPLLTAMTGNFIEPVIEKAVVDHDVKKVKGILGDGTKLADYLKKASAGAQASKAEMEALDSLFDAYKTGKITQKVLFEKLADKFSLGSLAETFKDSDDMTLLKDYHPDNLITTLQKMYETNRTIDKRGVEEAIASINAVLADSGFETISQKEVLDKIGKDFSMSHVLKVLEEFELNKEEIALVLEKSKVDEAKFFESVKKYYSGPFTQLKARVKSYMQLINPIVGSKAESLQTLKFKKSMKEILKALGVDDETIREVSKALKDGKETASGISAKTIKLVSEKIAGLSDDDYQKMMKTISEQSFGEEISGILEILTKKENIELIGNIEAEGADDLTKSILGIWKNAQQTAEVGNQDGLVSIFKKFIKNKEIDIEAIKAKAIMCANFERALKAGSLKELTPQEIAIARKVLYDGTASTAQSNGYASNIDSFRNVIRNIFDSKNFETERATLGDGIDKIADNLFKIFSKSSKSTPTEQYFACGSFTNHIKNFTTSIGNNKAWMKIFAPATVALIAITLLVQPFFGKIDKEFQQEGKNGGAK